MNHSIGDEKTQIQQERKESYSLREGQTLGQYRVIRALGRGGMGEVYEVEHEVLGGRFALKLLPAALEWQMSLERFKNEARVMFQLNHPNILKVDDFGETEGRYWLRMELVAAEPPDMEDGSWEMGGVTLQDYAEARGGRIPPEELAAILVQICEGLAYAHERGAIHRDLKPANILVETGAPTRPAEADQRRRLSASAGQEGSSLTSTLSPLPSPRVKISDFGLVRLVGEDWMRSRVEQSVRLSMSLGDQATQVGAGSEGSSTRSMVGTFEYMSPEQKRGEEVDERSDVYSLGMMAFRLLTGRNPGLRRPSELVTGLPDFWDSLLLDALEEAKADRLKSVAAFLRVLRGNSPSTGTVPGTAAPPPLPLAGAAASALSRESNRSDRSDKSGRPVVAPPRADDERQPGEEAEFEIYPGVKMKFCWCPATTSEAWKRISGGKDTFTMGSPEDEEGRYDTETQHEVKLTHGFWMGKYPVTQGQWEVVMGGNPSCFQNEIVLKEGFLGFGRETRKFSKPMHPVEQVSWEDGQEYLKKLKTEGGKGAYRLPTEAEWEYACRAGTRGRYAGKLDEMGWYSANSGSQTQEVGKKRANGWGLHDMHGNVWEWVADWYGAYPKGLHVDPTGPANGSYRVYRGGGWSGAAAYCRVASRIIVRPTSARSYLGFRVVLAPQFS
jgi:formylglycine-generating enzyme required for sulfatase activity/serine/threonine protein kinase